MNNRIEGEKRTARLSVALTPSRFEKLKTLSRILGKSVNDLINETIEDLLDSNSDSEITEQFDNAQNKAIKRYNSRRVKDSTPQ